MKKAIYPGSFDPLTNGHLDIIKRASTLYTKLIVGVTKNNNKSKFLFSDLERKDMIESCVKDIHNVEVKIFDGLLINFVQKEKSSIIIRGLRVLSDFEFEFKMALMNRNLDNNINTLFMMTHEKYTHISSSLLKEVSSLGGNINNYVPQNIKNKILLKINEKNKI